jgi:hypothetical protein
MTIQENIVMFLYRFKKLKNDINNAPRNLSWLAKEREDLQDLCNELERNYNAIIKYLSQKVDKHTFIKVPFEIELNEYKLNFRKHVSEAAEPSRLRCQEELEKIIHEAKEHWLESGKTEEEFWELIKKGFKENMPPFHPFNPLEDDPTLVIVDALDWANFVSEIIDEDDAERYEKVWGVWRFFTEGLGLDFSGINKRWLAAPELFIQPHVSQTEKSPIVELYNEAVRGYVFGCKIASVAMCRALMEYMLKTHYNVRGDDLEKIIAIAEQRFPQLQKLRMQGKRLFANKLLHNYETGIDIEDRAAIAFLRTIKILVQDVPGNKRN